MRLLTTLLKVFSKTICNQTVPEDGSEYFRIRANKYCALFVFDVAGVVGFEPTVHGIKTRCLTAWLHPNSIVVIS